MNSFGHISLHIFGESHGECVGLTIDGCPAGLPLSVDDFTTDIEEEKPGALGTTPRKEDDIPQIKTGLFNGKTTGNQSPSSLKIKIPAVRIMKSYVLCQGPAMPILLHQRNLGE